MDVTTFKIVMLGEGRVGKTSVSLRYVNGDWSPDQKSTVAAGFLQKKIHMSKKSIQLNIYDTAGQERFHALAPIYYRGAQGAVLVYDITDQPTFERVQRWVKELKKMADKNISLVIVGNKCDLESRREVDNDAAVEYVNSLGNADHVLASAKTALGIEQAFFTLARRMIKAKQSDRDRSKTVSVVAGGDIYAYGKEKKGCC